MEYLYWMRIFIKYNFPWGGYHFSSIRNGADFMKLRDKTQILGIPNLRRISTYPQMDQMAFYYAKTQY